MPTNATRAMADLLPALLQPGALITLLVLAGSVVLFISGWLAPEVTGLLAAALLATATATSAQHSGRLLLAKSSKRSSVQCTGTQSLADCETLDVTEAASLTYTTGICELTPKLNLALWLYDWEFDDVHIITRVHYV